MPPSPTFGRYLRYIAANVREGRRRLGFTQERLAELSGVDLKFLQQIEGAKTNLSVDILVRLAVALSVSPDQLLLPAVLAKSLRGRPRKN